MMKRGRGGEEMIRKGPWKAEEDEVLKRHVSKYGPRDWSSIRSNGLLHRTGKSCRLRWVNKLRPNLKIGCKFSPEEERIVIDLQAEYGNKWARIATHLPGRTDNDVKNFWSSRQKRLARILQTSASTSSSSSSRVKSKQTSITSNSQNMKSSMTMGKPCSSSLQVADDPDTLKLLHFSDILEPKTLFSYDHSLNLIIPEEDQQRGGIECQPMNTARAQHGIEYQPMCPFLHNSHPQPDLKFSPESHELLSGLHNPYLFDAFGLAYENAAQLPIEKSSLEPVGGKNGTSNGCSSKPVAPDTTFDDFPTDIFDHIEPHLDPSGW